MSDKIYIGPKALALEKGGELAPITRVTVVAEEELVYTAGDDTGRELELSCPWGTQRMAENILASVAGYQYRPFSAGGAQLDPAAELGDGITVAGLYSVLASAEASLDAASMADISAPGEREVDHEYPYESPQARELKRKVALGKSYYGAKITRREGLVIEKTDGDAVSARAVFNADELSFYDKANDRVLYFDPGTGTYQFKGTLNINDTFKVDKLGNVTMAGSLTLTGTSNWLQTRYSTNKSAPIPSGWTENWNDAWSNTSTQVWAIYSYNGGANWTQPMLAQGKDGPRGSSGPAGSDANVPDWVKAYTSTAVFNSLVTDEWMVTMNLYGSKIYGGAYYDEFGKTKLVLNPEKLTSGNADLRLYSGNNVAFQIYDSIDGTIAFRSYRNEYLTAGIHGAYAKGIWNFSSATVTGIPVRFG